MSQIIRAKFYCSSMTIIPDKTKGKLYNYKFSPVISGSEENKNFFAYTPSGVVELNSIVEDQFIPGKEYYIDFKLAEQE